MIGLRAAGVRFGERWIFRRLDFAPDAGRCVAVLGPNGRGKTTLIRSLLGFLALNEGDRSAPPVVGYVPQASAATVSYRARDVVTMGRVARRGLFATPSRDDRDAADRALTRVGLSALARQRFDLLSGGERQLVLLARALATDAGVLILDEPASALDLRNQDRFLGVVDRLKAEGRHTIVFSTHLPQHASAVADDALMLYGAEDHIFGPVGKVLNEDNLGRLYGIPVRIVEVEAAAGGRMVSGVIPVFGASVPA
ncbi:ABC transporter ATP-binding protein [Taklimakanibacter lacteus]|uniref:ABC transporter ATP-binding protein n=1 Tax=Taklimakanibacter lacteus TaxID=2268456 RepID=UPI000E673C21